MSSYLKELKNPKTGKKQKAACIDDFYGRHRYGYGFKKDGSDFNFGDSFDECEFFEDVEFDSK